MSHISQRAAQRFRKRVNELETLVEQQRSRWSQQYVGGVEIARCEWKDDLTIPTAIRVARKLTHAVVVVGDDGGTVRFVALPLSTEVI